MAQVLSLISGIQIPSTILVQELLLQVQRLQHTFRLLMLWVLDIIIVELRQQVQVAELQLRQLLLLLSMHFLPFQLSQPQRSLFVLEEHQRH